MTNYIITGGGAQAVPGERKVEFMAYERKKPQILLLDRWEKIIAEDLTDEEAGKILKAMYKYFNHGDHPAFQDRLLRWFWEDIEKWLNDSREWYDGIRGARSEAGKAGAKKRWGSIEDTTDSNSQQMLANDSNSQQMIATDGKDSNDNALMPNDNALMPNDRGQCAKHKDKHRASDNDNNPSNIQTTSIITEGAGKSAAAQPAPAQNAEPAAGNGVTVSLDGMDKKDPQIEAEALRINPGNFKKYFSGADDLDGATVVRYCKLRCEMIRKGADKEAVDRGIQKEISGA